MSSIITHDGTCIVVDPDVGAVSASTREEAEAEIRRRKALKLGRSPFGAMIARAAA